MCGIIGHVGSNVDKLNIDKFNILGILNEERGTDSCGVSMDGGTLKGVDYLSAYRNFIAYYSLNRPKYSTVVIGHTRKSTFGLHTIANAHPFGFGSHKYKGQRKSGFKFVGVHNGTLLNHTEIANDYKLTLMKETKIVTTDKETKITTTKEITSRKIDSELLLEALYKDENYEVLLKYNGTASLMWVNHNKPNTLFCFHGKSLGQQYDKIDPEKEERPLFYWQENIGSLYISSLEDSLFVIGGTSETIHSFKHNVVYEIKNGNIKKAILTEIDRSKNWQREGGYDYNRPNFQRATSHKISSAMGGMNGTDGGCKVGMSTRNFYPRIGSSQQIQLNITNSIDKGLLSEQYDQDPNENNGLTLFKNLRYWRNGHKTNGVYGFVAGKGFYYMGIDRSGAILTLQKGYAGMVYNKGEFITPKLARMRKLNPFIPFDKLLSNNSPDIYLYYMFDGIRYRTHNDWLNIKIDADRTNQIFDIQSLSICAAHPIISLETKYGISSPRVTGAYFQGQLANGKYGILGSHKIYEFGYGQIKNIEYAVGQVPNTLSEKPPYFDLKQADEFLTNAYKKFDKAGNEIIILPENIESTNEIIHELIKNESINGIIKEVKKRTALLTLSKDEEERVDAIILEQFNENFENFPKAMRILRHFRKGSIRAAIAYKTMQEFLAGCTKLVAEEMKKTRENDKK